LLTENHRAQIDAILAKYPPERKRSAVMPLLHLVQQARGYVAPEDLEEIASLLGISPTQVGSLVGFYSLYYDRPGGKYRVQICTDLPCALRGAEDFARDLCARLGIEPGETTADGLVSVERVMCLAACDRAPVFQVQDSTGLHYHENQTVETAVEFLETLREGIHRA
jgi:NADH-quinone oxidoreductase subunit E